MGAEQRKLTTPISELSHCQGRNLPLGVTWRLVGKHESDDIGRDKVTTSSRCATLLPHKDLKKKKENPVRGSGLFLTPSAPLNLRPLRALASFKVQWRP